MRPFTALRKVIQHYGSDEGAEMASVYLSVVSTVKLVGGVGMAFPRRLLRGRGDRRQEASWTPETVASIKKRKNNQQVIPKTDKNWPSNGSSGDYVSDF